MSKKLYKQAIETFGRESQILVAIEEMGELIQALSRHLTGKPDNLEEEMADVSIMMDQLLLIFDADVVKGWKKKKLKMLEQKLINKKQ